VGKSQAHQLSVNMKDVSDWIKIIILLGGLITGYVRLSAKVDDHTTRIGDVQDQLGQMRDENKQRNLHMEKEVGKIEMYICSKDNTHCIPDDPAQQ
jgi:hypothetical protein